MGLAVKAYIDSSESAPHTHLDAPVHTEPPRLLDAGDWIVIAIGDNFRRMEVTRQLRERFPRSDLPVLVHPSASIAASAKLGAGTVVLQGATVGAYAVIGDGCLVNSGAVVEHESSLGDFCSIGPGAALGGNVRVGVRAAIAIGATVKHGVSIGEDCVLGAASYAHRDVPPLCVAYGAPARWVRARVASDRYLG